MRRVRGLLAVMLVLASAGEAQAQQVDLSALSAVSPWAAAPSEPHAIPLYGVGNPGAPTDENWMQMGNDMSVRNVTYPTLTPVLPEPGKATGVAVVVAPGGAFMALSMKREGWDVAKALADRGIAAFVLKYRLIATPKDIRQIGSFTRDRMMREKGDPMRGTLLAESKAPADALAAIALVRASAAKWRIDPVRVGIIGFSAGAMTARRVAIDPPPAERPAFIGYIYGPQDSEPVPADAPPLFDAIALDDALFSSKGFPIAQEWLNAKRPVEVHGYQKGNHGFGLGVAGTSSALVLDEFVSWLATNNFLTLGKK